MKDFVFRVERSEIAHITIQAETAQEAEAKLDAMSDEDLNAEAFKNGVEETGLYTDWADPNDDPENSETKEGDDNGEEG